MRISNTGRPVPPGEAETLLEPFVHGQGTRVRTDGLGLGLSIVRAVTLAHRGRIAVAARTGGGLGITIDFPQNPVTKDARSQDIDSSYLDLAVRGVRSAEVSTKISRHLERPCAWLAAGLGHPRVSAVTAREITAWRDHLAAAGWRRKDGGAAAMAPAAVNNHLAHASALFSWINAHAPAALLPGGDPTKRVEPLRLTAPRSAR
nr:ATP-binding protein [Nonomuraea jabiensis]